MVFPKPFTYLINHPHHIQINIYNQTRQHLRKIKIENSPTPAVKKPQPKWGA